MKILKRNQLTDFLKEDFKAVYIKTEDFPEFTDSLTEDIQEVAYKIKQSKTGAVIFLNEKKFLLVPPVPVEKTLEGSMDYLFELLEKKYTLGVILLRLGEYSLGIFEGNELKTHKTGTQFVGGKTKAGGQSAARYQRIREGQINDFFKNVCFQVQEKFKPHEEKIDYIFFGGDSKIIKTFLKHCNYLEKFKKKNKVMQRVLNIRHMKLESLKKSLDEVWTFRIYEI